MIKATGTTSTGEQALIVGLTRQNIIRLTEGQPIRITAAEMVTMGLPPVEVDLHYGKTEQAILDKFRAHGVTAPVTVLGGDNVV